MLNDLEVSRVVALDSVVFHISPSIFAPFRKNNFFICAVEYEGVFRLRTFFLSRSQGIWRMLKAYEFSVKEDGREQPTWNDKGYDEQSLLLPLELQKTLFELSEIAPLDREESKSLFYGTVPLSDTPNWYEEYVAPESEKLEFVNYDAETPEELTKDTYHPEVSVVAHWKTDNPLYGELSYYLLSLDENHQVLFLKTQDERCFLGGIENIKSPITPIGLRKNWIDAGRLLTPLFEYKNERVDHTHGYGNEDIRSGSYVDMYKNYLSKVSFVQELKVFVG